MFWTTLPCFSMVSLMARIVRAEIFDPSEVAILHVMARTCRRCFLFGEDPFTQKNYDHRKVWIQEQLKVQAAFFGVDLITFAVMSNHFHLVLRSRPDVVKTWDDCEVARRWLMICPKRKDKHGIALKPTESELDLIRKDASVVKNVRNRLSDVSWWMRILCQKIAMRANHDEDEVGKFFQGRFKAVRLLDEEAILACSAYVDLNPIRAAIAKSIETSEFTSAKLRFEAAKLGSNLISMGPDSFLAPMTLDTSKGAEGPKPSRFKKRCSDKGVLPLASLDYLQLLDLTARMHRSDKAGYTPKELSPLLARLGIDVDQWRMLTKDFGRMFSQVAGKATTVGDARSRKTKRRFYLKRLVQ